MLTANLYANAIVAAVFLSVLNTLGGAGSFGVLAAAGFFFVYKLAPETKGRQLDDIRHYWENGGRWPEDTTSSELGRAASASIREARHGP